MDVDIERAETQRAAHEHMLDGRTVVRRRDPRAVAADALAELKRGLARERAERQIGPVVGDFDGTLLINAAKEAGTTGINAWKSDQAKAKQSSTDDEAAAAIIKADVAASNALAEALLKAKGKD